MIEIVIDHNRDDTNKDGRINTLARSKTIPKEFLDDTQSVYWNNNLTKDWTQQKDLNTKFATSIRLEQLTQSKTTHKGLADRPSPIWQVSADALNAKPTKRLEYLACSKKIHSDYTPPRQVRSVLSKAAKSATPSRRIEELAKPKGCSDFPTGEYYWDNSALTSDIPESALKHDASQRLLDLATPKDFHIDYKERKSVQWKVTKAARRALPTERTELLARPKSNGTYKDCYDPSWFQVVPAARKAHMTQRLEELAKPVRRKVREKKVLKSAK